MNTDEIVFGVSLGNTELVIYNCEGGWLIFQNFKNILLEFPRFQDTQRRQDIFRTPQSPGLTIQSRTKWD